MGSLILKLTGPPQVTFKGQPLKFRSRKVLALLIYLVIERGVHRREKLTALLWPESDETRARASLRNTLYRLRQSLNQAGEYLLINPETVAFDFSQPHQIDLDVPGNFLEGFALLDAPEFDHWITLQRLTHHQRLEKRTQELFEQGLFQRAIEIATQWFTHDPLNEAAARQLMQARFLTGDRAGALAAYATLTHTLAEELSLSPASETTALAETIRTLASPSAGPHLAFEAQSRANLPFVGRAAEHRQLAAAYRRARQGETQALCVVGEAGIGKTRLVEFFLDWAALQEPVDILRGRAFEIGGRLPYQPLVEALRLRLDAENAPEDLLPDVWLAELSQLLPELRERYPDLPQPLKGSPEFTRSRLFEAVTVLGQALAVRKPIILFIDDVQWADMGTFDMLHYLTRRWTESRAPVFFIWAVRLEDLASTLPLREWLTHVGRGTLLNRVQLTPLADGDLRQLVDSLAGAVEHRAPESEKFSDWLKQETGGQPFFVTEMLKMLEERGILTGGDIGAALRKLRTGGQVPVPPTVRELILARVGRLSESATALLLAAAVIGREASFEVLVQIAGSDEERGIAALEELLDSRLLVETGYGLHPYRFTHDNIRDVMYIEAGEIRRRIYHRRAFASLEGTAPAAELAFHAHAAGMAASAFEYSFVAGDEAMAKYAFADAVAQYARALEWVDQVEVTPQKRCDLYVRHGRALELNGEYAKALVHFQKMESLARQWEDQPLELAALTAQGTIFVTANDQNDMSRGEKLCQQALALAKELGDEATEAKIQWNLLNVFRMTGRNEQGLAAGERSLALAEKLGMREQLAYTTNDLGYIYQANADMEAMNHVLEIAIPLWRELGNLPMLTDSLTSYANTLVFWGDFDRALEISQEAQAISKTLNNPWSQSFTLFTPCFVHWFRMEISPALEAMQRCISLGQEVGFVGGMVTMSNYQTQLLLDLGQVEMAHEVMQGIRALAERNIPLFLTGACGADAMVAMREGNLAKAGEILGSFSFDQPLFDLMNSFTLENSLCEYLLRTHAFNKLGSFAGKVVPFLKARHFVAFLPQFLYWQAQAHYGLGEIDSAWDVLQEALTIYDQFSVQWKKWQVLGLRVEIAESRGQKAIAGRVREQARETIEWIANQIGHEDHRSTFLGIPELKQVIL